MSNKATAENLQFMNHVELYKNKVLQWAGVIVSRTFQGSDIVIQCYGYLWLLSKRRMVAKTYASMTCGALVTTVLNEINAIASTGLSVGTIETGSLNTERLVENTDIVSEKLLNWVDDGNYNLEVDANRDMNFYLSKGSLKSAYQIIMSDDYSNIVGTPDLGQVALDMANVIYSKTDSLSQEYSDATSIGLFGRLEGTYSASSSIVNQATLDSYVTSELQRRAYPLYSAGLTIVDSAQCPFDDIEVGDTIPVSLEPYWGFTADMRILEIRHNVITDPSGADKDTRNLTLGSLVYRQAKPTKKIYKG